MHFLNAPQAAQAVCDADGSIQCLLLHDVGRESIADKLALQGAAGEWLDRMNQSSVWPLLRPREKGIRACLPLASTRTYGKEAATTAAAFVTRPQRSKSGTAVTVELR